MILTPHLGKRRPDLRYEIEPKTKSAKATAKALEQLMRRGKKCFVRLRSRNDIFALASRARVMVDSQIDEIRTSGQCTIVPKRARRYDDFARRTFIEESECFVFTYDDDDDLDAPGEPLQLNVSDAIPLLRDEPEMYGLLFEEVDPSELEIEPVKIKPKKSGRKKSGRKSKKKADDKADDKKGAPPSPAEANKK